MTKQVHFLSPEDDLLSARKLMEEHKIHHLPVLKNEKLVGVISHNDILQVAYLAEFIGEKLDDSSVFKSLSLHELMTKDIYFISSDASISEAIHVFSKADFHCLPVIEDDAIVGIVTSKDLFSLMDAEHL